MAVIPAGTSLTALFKELDSNHDGKLNFKETLTFGEVAYEKALPTRPYDRETALLLLARTAFAAAGQSIDSAGVTQADVETMIGESLAAILARPGVASEAAAVLFERYDKDHSGCIDRGEASSLIRCLFAIGGQAVSADVASAAVAPIFREIDADGSRTLNHAELITLIQGLAGGV